MDSDERAENEGAKIDERLNCKVAGDAVPRPLGFTALMPIPVE